MFQPATTALVWAACFLLLASTTAQRRPRLGWWLAMVAALTVALYSYLFAAFALPAAGLVLLGPLVHWLRTRQTAKASGPSGLVVFVEKRLHKRLAGLIFLPLARNAWLANASDGKPGTAFMNLGANLLRQLEIATIWRVDWVAPWVEVVLGLFAVLLVTGLLVPGHVSVPSRTWACRSCDGRESR